MRSFTPLIRAMVSVQYIVGKTHSMGLHLQLARHLLISPVTSKVREKFVQSEVQAMAKVVAQLQVENDGTDREMDSEFHEMELKSLSKGLAQQLTSNFHHLREFSEHRFRQMELLLRYSQFESLLLAVVGTILWEYEDRLGETEKFLKAQELGPGGLPGHIKPKRNASLRRAWRTWKAVQAIDSLPFDRERVPRNARTPKTVFLWHLAEDVLLIGRALRPLYAFLERAREMRNHIVHEDPDFVVPETVAPGMFNAMSAYPLLLCRAAIPLYPLACSEEPRDDGDDGTPGYKIAMMDVEDLF